MSDIVNVSDDHPELLFGLAIDGNLEDSEVSPFYLSLRIHDFILHNAMLDSRASHSLMPKAIMDKLGLDITQSYHDLYSFGSGRVKCLSVFKDLVVSLDQFLLKNVLMDVVVADIPPRYGMFLCSSWGEKIKGTLQLGFSYAIIPVFGQIRKLHWETKMKYMITSKEKSNNHPIHVVHIDLESFILYNYNSSLFDNSLVYLESHIEEISKISEVSGSVEAVPLAENQERGLNGL